MPIIKMFYILQNMFIAIVVDMCQNLAPVSHQAIIIYYLTYKLTWICYLWVLHWLSSPPPKNISVHLLSTVNWPWVWGNVCDRQHALEGRLHPSLHSVVLSSRCIMTNIECESFEHLFNLTLRNVWKMFEKCNMNIFQK